MERERQTNNLRDLLTVLFKHKYKIITVFLATVATVTAASFLIPPTYEGSSSIMIKFGREHIYRSEIDDLIPPIINLNQEYINSEVEILKSLDLIEQVITSIGLGEIYPDLTKDPPKEITPLSAAMLRFKKKLSVENVTKSNVIQVSFRHENPQIAANAVNQLIDYFKEKHLEIFSDPKASFMGNQLMIYRQKLQESEDNLEAFKQQHGIISIVEQRRLLLEQRVGLDTSLKDAENRLVELQQKLTSLKKWMHTVSENVPQYQETERYQIIDDAKSKLLELQLREQELIGSYNENSRLLVNVRTEIALVKEFLEDQGKDIKKKVRTGKNEVYQGIEMQVGDTEAERSSLTAKIATIKEQIAQLDNQMEDLELRDKELTNLQREVVINEENYQTYVKKLEEARITTDMDQQKMVSIRVIQAATVPVRPVKPRKRLNIMLGIILGICSGLGLALSSEFIGQRLSTPEKAESRLGLPVLITVSFKKAIADY